MSSILTFFAGLRTRPFRSRTEWVAAMKANLPSGSSTNSMRSPVSRPSGARTLAGIVTWPLDVSVAVAMSFAPLSMGYPYPNVRSNVNQCFRPADIFLYCTIPRSSPTVVASTVRTYAFCTRLPSSNHLYFPGTGQAVGVTKSGVPSSHFLQAIPILARSSSGADGCRKAHCSMYGLGKSGALRVIYTAHLRQGRY